MAWALGAARIFFIVCGWVLRFGMDYRTGTTLPPTTASVPTSALGNKREPRQPATGLSFQHEALRRLKARSSIRNNSLPPSEGRQSFRPCKPWRSAASESVSQKRDCVLKALADILGSDERFTNSGNYWKHSAIITEIRYYLSKDKWRSPPF